MKHNGVGMSLVIKSKDSKLLVSNIIINMKNGSRTIMNNKRFDWIKTFFKVNSFKI